MTAEPFAGCILLGPAKGDDGLLHCSCCGIVVTFDDCCGPTCWPCGVGENLACDRCVARGAPFNRFRVGGKMHRIREAMARDATHAVAACGYRVKRAEVGQATGVIFDYCKHCWGDDDDDEATRMAHEQGHPCVS